MLNVCEEEISKIKFFGISNETIVEVCKSLEERFPSRSTVPCTRNSHHFIPLLSSKITHKLSSEDKSHAGTHDFNLPAALQLCDIRSMTYVTCLYNSFWCVQNKVWSKFNLCSHTGHVKHLIGEKLKIQAMC